MQGHTIDGAEARRRGAAVFMKALRALGRKAGPTRWVYAHEDQLSDRIGPVARAASSAAGELGVVLVESWWKAGRRPYHRQRLALGWANQRQFALELARRGVTVRYVWSEEPCRDTLARLASELGPLPLMTPAERETRADLAPLLERGALVEEPHGGWLTTTDDFRTSHPPDRGPPWKMDSFYRAVRRRTGILMENGSFAGGKVSFDGENREPWSGEPPAATPPVFEPDDVTAEVIELIGRAFERHPGKVDAASLPSTAADADRLWAWAKRACLPTFGPFEDAMSVRSRTIFHTRLSALINLHRLLPERVVREAESASIPLASKEGFIRQILGWREFVRHVHEATDGFRVWPGGAPTRADAPGDGGFARWSGTSWDATVGPPGVDGGATPAELGSATPLPPAYWGAPSGLACLDHVVASVWEEAYSHHITRLMVLSNIATLLDVSPRELTDWFWVAYADAWDWVVEPNVLGMGTYAVGGVMTTKPYVAGSAYIDRMSDYCAGCAFDPARTCPITRLYWAFLERHKDRLQGNPRLFMPMNALGKRSTEQKAGDAATFVHVRDVLVRGERLMPGQPDGLFGVAAKVRKPRRSSR